MKLQRITRCARRRFITRKAGTFRARFGPKRAEVRIRRPKPGFYFARFAFGGRTSCARSRRPIRCA